MTIERSGRPRITIQPRLSAATEAALPPVKALRIVDAANYLSVSPSFVRKLIRDRKVRSITLGRARLVLVSSLSALLGEKA